MGLLITATETAKIKIKGTEIEIPSVYARVEFAGYSDGKTMEIAFKTFSSVLEYQSEQPTPIGTSITNHFGGNLRTQLGELEVQGLDTAFAKLSAKLEEMGYTTEII